MYVRGAVEKQAQKVQSLYYAFQGTECSRILTVVAVERGSFWVKAKEHAQTRITGHGCFVRQNGPVEFFLCRRDGSVSPAFLKNLKGFINVFLQREQGETPASWCIALQRPGKSMESPCPFADTDILRWHSPNSIVVDNQ